MSQFISRRHLAAAIHTAAVKDVRFYLVGVHIDGRVMVSTDGTCASAYLGEECDEYLPPFTIPLEVVKRIVKRKTERLEVSAGAYPFGSWVKVGDEMFRPLDGKFPDYRRVFWQARDPLPGGVYVDPEILVKFSRVGQVMKASSVPVLYSTGSGPGQTLRVALGGCDAEFMGLIMPTRLKELPSCGEWLI